MTNISPFDRETINLYQFSIRAQDNAAIPRFGFTTVSNTHNYDQESDKMSNEQFLENLSTIV